MSIDESETVLKDIGRMSVEDIDGLLEKLEAQGIDMKVKVDIDRLTDK